MTDPSASRCPDSLGRLTDGWRFDTQGPQSAVSRSSVAREDKLPWVSLSPPAVTPYFDRSIDRTQTHEPLSSERPREIIYPPSGGKIGGFRILSELGRGAFARVYLAEQVDLADRLVALKVGEALGEEPQALARLQHTHIVPIYSVHDDQRSGLRLLCMPYVGGANLAQVLERSGARLPSQASGRSLVEALDGLGGRPPVCALPSRVEGSDGSCGSLAGAASRGLGSPTAVRSILGRYWARLPWWKGLEPEGQPVPDRPADDDHNQPARRFLRSHTYVQAAAWIGARLAEGLEHAHSRGILHRDLKPSNILIAADGTPMLLDFNLAAETAPRESADGARAMLGGTLPYMAPEHLDAFNPKGETSAAAVDARSDLYSLGLILYEMLAGRHPFEDPPGGIGVVDIVARMTEERRRGVPPARGLNPMIPPSLDAIVSRCLAPDPARRYERVADLAEDLQRFLDDRPNAHAPEPSLRERAAKWWRRHPEVRGAGPVTAAAAVLLLAILGIARSISDSAEGARARVQRDRFHDGFRRCQLLLNTSSGPISHLAQGITRAEGLMKSYGGEAGDWTAGPMVRRLPQADRTALREEMSELMLLVSRARMAGVRRGAPEPARRKALESAVALLDQAERIDPRPSAALFETRARYLAALGESARARADRARAGRTPPETARDYYLRGTDFAAQGQFERAELDLGKALTKDPRQFWAWFVRGLCRYDRGRYAEAAADFGSCTILAHDFPWPYLNRGLALAASGQLDEARASYDRALALDPDFVEALIDRALVCLELNDPAQAERDLGHALALGRRDAEILTVRAEVLARLGRRKQADREFAEALKVRPDDPRILVARGISRIAVDPEGSRADLARILARDPRSARAHYGMAMLLRDDDPRAAIDHLNRSLDAEPDGFDSLRLRAVTFGRLGDPAAVADAERLARKPSAHNLYNAACALALLDSSIGSKAHRTRARELLRLALDLGFPRRVAESDPDLRALFAKEQATPRGAGPD